MAVYKCKMCGGDLDIAPGITVTECEYCGTKQTLPKANEEVVRNLFNRANALRLKCEFDKAEQIYEKIVQEDNTESEAHWGIVLCKYGIEYVEDPKTYKRIPTCHRTSYDAVTADPDYLAAVEYADATQRHLYEAEAKAIDEIQKNILTIVKEEKPFDVFLCYKETDEDGKRTVDSAIANDIYHQLTQEGLKVFYAAITLEDKLGEAYEPYIFAALNSAKVMLVIGTKPEYFSAVWVKNEWSRFLKQIKTDRSKLLIPCYKGMDAYELPEEFSHLQAQDMSKIGFINDVVRGIKKVTHKDEPQPTVVKETIVTGNTNSTNTSTQLKRAFMFLEDGEWDRADEICEQVLKSDPDCAQAYLGKLMAELHIKKQEDLKNCAQPFDVRSNNRKTKRKKLITGITIAAICVIAIVAVIFYTVITVRIPNSKYNHAVALMKSGKYTEAISAFEALKGYKDSADKIKECNASLQLETAYSHAVAALAEGNPWKAAIHFGAAGNYQDAKEQSATLWNQIAVRETISANGITVGLKSDGTVVAVGDNSYGQCNTNDWQDIVAISTGNQHTIGLKADGTVIAIGDNSYGQCNTSDWQDIVAISAGTSHTVGLKHDGTVVAVGMNSDGQCKVSSWTNIVAISAGDCHTVGLTADGTMVAVGNNSDGQCKVGGWTNIVAINTGNQHTIGLKADGTVVAVGKNSDGQCKVSDWQNIVAISAGAWHTIGLKADGTVMAVGNNYNNQCDVSNWENIVAISAGAFHTAGLKANGTVVAVGVSASGRCDVRDWANILVNP